MITYEDYVKKNSVPNLKDMSKDALYERGKYLIEVIDKQSDVLTGKEINDELLSHYVKNRESDPDHLVLPYGPSMGKTTAIRQFILDSDTSGVYSVKTREEARRIYYDLVSCITYRHDKSSSPDDTMYYLFESIDKLDTDKISLAKWVICTHERLSMEPNSILFKYSPINIQNKYFVSPTMSRMYLVLDEYPKMGYSVNLSDISVVVGLDADADISDEVAKLGHTGFTDNESQYIARQNYVVSQFQSPEDPINALLDKIPIQHHQNQFSLALKKSSKNLPQEKVDMDLARLGYYYDYFSKQYQQYTQDKKNRNPDQTKLYYTVYDMPVSQAVVLLDGTGDILLEGTGWDIIDIPDKYRRSLSLDDLKLVDTKVSRNDEMDKVAGSYVSMIEKIARINPDSQILVYMWKSLKNGTNDTDLLKNVDSQLESLGITNVNIVTYMSGKEKATNEYMTSNVAIILGNFYIPNSVIFDMNMMNHSERQDDGIYPITNKRNTLSLIIQFIYRTVARSHDQSNNSIKLYLDEKYSSLLPDLQNVINIKTPDVFDNIETINNDYLSSYGQRFIKTLKSKYKYFTVDNGKCLVFKTRDVIINELGKKSFKMADRVHKWLTSQGLIEYRKTTINIGDQYGQLSILVIPTEYYDKDILNEVTIETEGLREKGKSLI